MSIFTAKVALVTGGGTGIGRATAVDFAQKGASVLIADLKESDGQQTVVLIKNAGGQAAFVLADVSKPVVLLQASQKCPWRIG
jgi:NAD(P)-dependent dehydrogenase (short-subunit alcohol dehydrogenase family)